MSESQAALKGWYMRKFGGYRWWCERPSSFLRPVLRLISLSCSLIRGILFAFVVPQTTCQRWYQSCVPRTCCCLHGDSWRYFSFHWRCFIIMQIGIEPYHHGFLVACVGYGTSCIYWPTWMTISNIRAAYGHHTCCRCPTYDLIMGILIGLLLKALWGINRLTSVMRDKVVWLLFLRD